MEVFSYIACFVLGIALGVGGDWLFWQIRFKQANDRVQEESKAVGLSFNSQIEEKERQVASIDKELRALRETSQSEMAALREKFDAVQKRLNDEGGRLIVAEALNKRLPELEKAVETREAAMEQLEIEKDEAIARLQAEKDAVIARQEEEKAELADTIAAMRARIAEERKSFEEGVMFVPGGHYLPAAVIRNLTRSSGGRRQGGTEED